MCEEGISITPRNDTALLPHPPSYNFDFIVTHPISCKMSSRSTSLKSKQSENKVYSCVYEGCGRSFSKKWNLHAHERVHTGIKPFECRHGCGQWYMWMSSRKGHEENKCHLSQTKSMSNSSPQSRSSNNGRKQKSSQKSKTQRPPPGKQSSNSTSHSRDSRQKAPSTRKEHGHRRSQGSGEDWLFFESTFGNSVGGGHGRKLSPADDLLSDEVMDTVLEYVQSGDRALEDVKLPECHHFTEMFMQRMVEAVDGSRGS